MFRKNNDLKYGFNQLCDSEKDAMYMDIFLLKSRKGDSWKISSPTKETAILLLQGNITFHISGKKIPAQRKNCFYDDPICLHMCKSTEVTITFENDGEVLIQQKENNKDFQWVIYNTANIDKQFFGEGKLASTTKRQVTTILDYERTPYSNMVLGEIINFPGIWSSFPPHSHPQPEAYFYKFDHEQGFGTCFIGDDAYKISNNCLAMIPGGLTHPQNAAPGYAMFYVWMIPHLEDNPWIKTRIFDPKHVWINEENAEIFQLNK